MIKKNEPGALFLSILDLDTLINKLEEIDDLTSDIDLKFPFKIDSLICIIREKSFELDDYLKEELKYKGDEMKSKDYIEKLNNCCYYGDYIKLFTESIYEILKEIEDKKDE